MAFFSQQIEQIAWKYFGGELSKVRNRIFDSAASIDAYDGLRRLVALSNGLRYRYDSTDTGEVDNVVRINATGKTVGRWVCDNTEIDIRRFNIIPGRNVSSSIRTANVAGLQKAARCGFPVKVPGLDFECTGTALATNVPVNFRGIPFKSRFIVCSDLDLLRIYNEASVIPVQLYGISFIANGRDSQNNRIAFTNSIALRIHHYNVQPEHDVFNKKTTTLIEKCLVQGEDYDQVSPPVQEFKGAVDLVAPGGLIIDKCWFRGADGEEAKNTTLLNITASRRAVDWRITNVYTELATTCMKIAGSLFPSIEGVYVDHCTAEGNQFGIIFRSEGYMSPLWQITNTHIKSAQRCVQAFNITQLTIADCTMYCQGTTSPNGSIFVTLETCNGTKVYGNTFLVTPEGGTTNDVGGIYVNSFQFDPYIPSVRGEIYDNSFATLGPPMNTPAVYLGSQLVLLWKVYRNVAAGFRPNDVWHRDNKSNKVFDNEPTDIADAYQKIELTPVDNNDLTKGWMLDNLYGYSTALFMPTNSPGKRVTQMLGPYGKRFGVLWPANTTIVHDPEHLWLDGEKNITTSREFWMEFMYISRNGVTGLMRELKDTLPITSTTPSVTVSSVGSLGQWVDDAVTVTSLTITGDMGITEGTTKPYTVTATLSNGMTQDVTSTATKSVTGTGATWGSDGTLTADSNSTSGDTHDITLNASYGGQTAIPKTVTVYDATAGPYITSYTISTSPGSLTEASSGTLSAQVKINYSSGPSTNYTTGGTYSLPSGAPSGMGFTANANGAATITAPANGSISANQTITLTFTFPSGSGISPITIGILLINVDDTIAYSISKNATSLTEGSGSTVNLQLKKSVNGGAYSNYTDAGDFSVTPSYEGMVLSATSAGAATLSAPGQGAITANQTVTITFTLPNGSTVNDTVSLVNTDDTEIEPTIPFTWGFAYNTEPNSFPENDVASTVGFYLPHGGKWRQYSSAMHQYSEVVTDDQFSLVYTENGPDAYNTTEVYALIMPVSFTNPSTSTRFGVGTRHHTDGTGGYTFVLHYTTNLVQFIHDGVTLGPSFTYNWQAGVKYWIAIKYVVVGSTATIMAKIWKSTEAQPSTWAYQWTSQPLRDGYPAVIGGAYLTAGEAAKANIYQWKGFVPS